MVAGQPRGPSADGLSPTPILELEIYPKGGEKKTIEPGAPTLEWHFWEDGKKVAVHSALRVRQGTYALYESATARLVEKLAEPTNNSVLPQWARSQAQVQDESVPMSTALTQDRTYWIAKVLRQIDKIEPGMQRKVLRDVFTTEGGISSPKFRSWLSGI
jgi:hypothetical protein